MSTLPATNCSRPAPEPVGLYEMFLPWHTWPQVWANTAMAFCWADEPSAVRVFLPPHSSAEPAATVPVSPPPLDPDVPALLSLPHPARASAAMAAAETVVPNVLPMLLSFTYPTFGWLQTHGQRMRLWWTDRGWQVNAR